MDYKSAERIANFVNDVGDCDIICHLHELKRKFELMFGFGDNSKKIVLDIYPVLTLDIKNYQLNANLKFIDSVKEEPKTDDSLSFPKKHDSYQYEDTKPVHRIDYDDNYTYRHLAEILECMPIQGLNPKACDYHLNARVVRELMAYVGSVQELLVTPFNHIHLQKEPLSQKNQKPFAKAIARIFGMFNPEIICLSLSELTKQGTSYLVPVFQDKTWSMYVSQNFKLKYGVPFHHTALWNGFDDEGLVYFNAHITRDTAYKFYQLLEQQDFKGTTELSEFLNNFQLEPFQGDIVPKTVLSKIIAEGEPQ